MAKDNYCQALISATTEAEARAICNALLEKRLIAGCMITQGQSRYWWQGKLTEKTYWNLSAFTIQKNKKKIIAETRKIHSDKCPIIAFTAIDGNNEFLKWISESITQK